MGRRSLDTKRNRTWWIVGGAAAVVVLAVTAVGVAVAVNSGPGPRTGVASSRVKPDMSVHSVNVPATFEGWAANPAVGAGLQADASADGLSARFDVGAATPIMTQTVIVQPNERYTVSATYRSGESDEGLAAITVGSGAPVELEASDEWKSVEFEFMSEDAPEVLLTLQSSGALHGFQLANISMKPEAGDELIANADFDVFTAPTRITNPSLFMNTRSAYLGVSAPVSEISWTVAGIDGVEALAGTTAAQGGLSLIQLDELSQGFYTVTMSAPEPGLPAGKVSLVVLDDVVPELLDDRLGTTVHLYVAHSAGADALAETLGYGNIRVDAAWNNNETAEGVYEFPAKLDAMYAGFRDRGMHVLPIAAYGDPLYDKGRTPSSPQGLAAYARYAAAVTTHYDVDAISIYNEFNHLPFNTGACGPTPACYMEMLVPAAEAVRAARPGTLIVGPENAHKDDDFLTGLYQAGGLNYLDAVSFHPYDYGFEENGSPEFLVESLAQAGARILEYNTDDTPPPVWITELGWTSVLTDSEAQQGDFLARAEIISVASGVERFYWYDMISDNQSPTDNIGNFGIVRQATEQVPVFEPKPAAAAQAIVSRMLAGKDFVAQDDIGPDIYSYRFGEGATAVTAAWALTPTTVSYKAEKPVQITSITGEKRTEQPVDGVVSIELGPSPVFLSASAAAPSLSGQK